MFWKRIYVGDQERVLVIRNGRFSTILEPGSYLLFDSPFGKLELVVCNIREIVFQNTWADFLLRERPALVERNFVRVETRDNEVALIYIEDKLCKVLGPGKRLLFWRQASSVVYELIDVTAEPEVPSSRLAVLERLGRESLVSVFAVEDSRVGLLFLDGRFTRALTPGRYGFWSTWGNPRVDMVDLRLQPLEIPGQEILTKDKVSLRVNITAEYQVMDAIRAKQAVKDYAEFLYRAIQMAVRQTLGKKTLEEILADKTDVDETVAAHVRADAEAIGVRVGVIALKDIVLPGEMREILNQVVTAEKQAQANLIRRREETAATRSLLNTAKLMEDNPILVRLKELETLEKVVEKVDRVSVTNGFDGLLDQLVSFKPRGER